VYDSLSHTDFFKYSCENPTIWYGDKSKKFKITTLLVAIDHDYSLHSPSKLVDVGCEVLLDEPPHKVCLGVHFQPLHLGHILEEHIGRDFIVGIRSEAIFEVVQVKPKANKSAHGLARHTRTRLPRLKLTAGRVHSLEKCEG